MSKTLFSNVNNIQSLIPKDQEKNNTMFKSFLRHPSSSSLLPGQSLVPSHTFAAGRQVPSEHVYVPVAQSHASFVS